MVLKTNDKIKFFSNIVGDGIGGTDIFVKVQILHLFGQIFQTERFVPSQTPWGGKIDYISITAMLIIVLNM